MEDMKWDSFFRQVFLDVHQSKTSKTKQAGFGAGANRHIDWFLAFGDQLTLVRRNFYNPESTTWLFPNLKGNEPRKTLNAYISALKATGGAKKYEAWSISEANLPRDATAGGARPGSLSAHGFR